MIEHVRTIGFKGFDLDEDVPQKVIYHGKNKSGKSTRAWAITLALYGQIPFSEAGKLPAKILESFGDESLVVAATIKGKEFGRKFLRNTKGGVSQSIQVNGIRQSAENFAVLIDKVGAPKIANIAEFMKQSEAKKVDTLFELFPNDKLANIDIEIETAKDDISRLDKKKKGAESTVVRLTNSKNAIELPQGSIAETQADIKNIDIQISDLEEKIKQAEIEEAEIKAAAKKEAEIKAAAKESAAIPKPATMTVEADAPASMGDGPFQTSCETSMVVKNIDPFNSDNQFNPIDSIKRIIEALTVSGCNTCAALIVAKQELKKYGKSNG